MAYVGTGSSGQILRTENRNNAWFNQISDVVSNSVSGTYDLTGLDQNSVVVHAASGTTLYKLPDSAIGEIYTLFHNGPLTEGPANNFMRIQAVSGDSIYYGEHLMNYPGYLELRKPGVSFTLQKITASDWLVVDAIHEWNNKNNIYVDGTNDIGFIGGDTWTTESAVDVTTRRNLAFAQCLNYGFNIGGLASGVATATTTRFNFTTRSFTTVGSLNTALWGKDASELNQKIIATHGQSAGAGITNVTEQYNLFSNAWTTKATNPVSSRYGAGFNLNAFYFSCGGRDNVNAAVNTVTKYNDNADSWATEAETILAARTGLASWILGGFGYAAFGDTTGGSGGELNNIDRYDDSLKLWIARGTTTAKSFCSAFGLNDYAYIAGGNINPTAQSTNYEYDQIRNSTTTKPSALPDTLTDPGAFFGRGYGYLASGLGSGGVTDAIRRYN